MASNPFECIQAHGRFRNMPLGSINRHIRRHLKIVNANNYLFLTHTFAFWIRKTCKKNFFQVLFSTLGMVTIIHFEMTDEIEIFLNYFPGSHNYCSDCEEDEEWRVQVPVAAYGPNVCQIQCSSWQCNESRNENAEMAK